jgi:hypothetical protein
MGLEPTNLLTASQALYQLSYAPVGVQIVPSALVREVRDHVRPGVPRRPLGRLPPFRNRSSVGNDPGDLADGVLVHLQPDTVCDVECQLVARAQMGEGLI